MPPPISSSCDPVTFFWRVLFCGFLVLGLSTPALAESFYGEVIAVTDGDTIKVLGAQGVVKVRLAGIDAPERKQDFGDVAHRVLDQQLTGKNVTVSFTKLDRYRRVIGVVRTDDRDVGLALITAGLAWHYKKYADEQSPADRQLYALAETEARLQAAGLWQAGDAVAPWAFRRQGKGH